MNIDDQTLEEQWWAGYRHDHTAMDDYESSGIRSAADYFRLAVDAVPDAPALICAHTEATLTFRELDNLSNSIAWYMRDTMGLREGDVMCLMMENRLEFLACWLGAAKVGATSALINTSLRARLLNHAINVSEADHVLVSQEMLAHVAEAGVPAEVHVFEDLELPPSTPFPAEYRSNVDWNDALFYVYTSGTTGKSKAAIFSHRRFIGAGVTWERHMQLTMNDRFYNTLPLYHGNGGVVAVSAAMRARIPLIVRRKFSASNFFRDVRRLRCTATIYIGELWTYICAQPPRDDDAENPLRVAAGNGLRTDRWIEVQRRFGVERLVEHYGQTEMPAAHPMINSYGIPGSCGYIPPSVRGSAGTEKLVAFDVLHNEPIRGADGFFVPVNPGEPGEAIVRLGDGVYNGYSSKEATERVLYRNAFEEGDVWYSSGDLLRCDDRGFFFFVDRAGDSYRWKGENVSANDVGGILLQVEGVSEAAVYGVQVPHCEGRCGMVALSLEPGCAVEATVAAVVEAGEAELPAYAVPRFYRILTGECNKTTTFKLQKALYAQEGYSGSTDTVYFRCPASGLIPVDEDLIGRLEANEIRL